MKNAIVANQFRLSDQDIMTAYPTDVAGDKGLYQVVLHTSHKGYNEYQTTLTAEQVVKWDVKHPYTLHNVNSDPSLTLDRSKVERFSSNDLALHHGRMERDLLSILKNLPHSQEAASLLDLLDHTVAV